MPLNRYLFLCAIPLLLASCQRSNNTPVTVCVQGHETLVGVSANDFSATRFATYNQTTLRQAVTVALKKQLEGRNIEVVSAASQADYIVTLDELTLTDERVENAYGDACTPSGYQYVWVNKSHLTLYGTLHNTTNDQAIPWQYSELFIDDVSECYDEEQCCTHYTVRCETDKRVLKHYNKKTAKRLRTLLTADYEAQ